MIGFNTFSNASGLACFAASVQNQVEGMSTEWQSSPNRSDTTNRVRPAISNRGTPAIVSQASDVGVTQAATHYQSDDVESKQAKQAVRPEAQGMLKATARQFMIFTDMFFGRAAGRSRRQ
jgi:hypothetical protein